MPRVHQSFDNVEKAGLPTDVAVSDDREVNEKAPFVTPDGEEPNEDEKRTLKRVAEHLPASAWLVAVVELCERFTYYGTQGIFQNYIQRPLDGSKGRGALGMGHEGATGLSTFFQFWCYGMIISQIPGNL